MIAFITQTSAEEIFSSVGPNLFSNWLEIVCNRNSFHLLDQILVTSNDSRIRLYDLRDLSLSCKYRGYTNSSSQIRASFRWADAILFVSKLFFQSWGLHSTEGSCFAHRVRFLAFPQNFLRKCLMSLGFIDRAAWSKVDRTLKMLIEPI